MYVHTTHATLLQNLAAGDKPAAWAEFCERYGDLIRSFAKRQGLQAADCDDVLQDVLVALTRDLPTFQYDKTKGRFRGYLKRVTLNVIFKRFRRKEARQRPEELKTEIDAAEDDADVDALWEAEWRNHHVRSAMRTVEAEFNENDRLAFQQYAVNGQDATRTADALGLTIDQVYQAKSRIARRLGELIEEQIADEG